MAEGHKYCQNVEHKVVQAHREFLRARKSTDKQTRTSKQILSAKGSKPVSLKSVESDRKSKAAKTKKYNTAVPYN